MRGGRREGSLRLARSSRRRESSGEARTAPRAGGRDPERRPAGPCALSAPARGRRPAGSPLLTHVATPQARAVPGPELRLDHLWGVPGQKGDRRWQAVRRQPGLEQPCSLPSAPGTAGPHQGHPPPGRPLPWIPSALSESQDTLHPCPAPGAWELSREARGLEPGAGRPAPPAPSVACEAP